ncbi:(Na+)-NQR maturation NqrM [Catenovulum sp. 2E275]|uniref:(Na+)-NQR maturation NqrM n=1 Tax=Catenovulum sp. 2E275 TaxID=2980497 RepID=UPI0021CFD122|nr:(Na+)-NQR maturation NqrM [Catenovulum sp. 2E275]MCU4674898.1 (Na+)-NQR maturation NqrM [Catenovulum sp. 2E275]
MTTILLAFGIFLIVVVAMSVGFIIQKKSISGSCGGLGAIGVEKACDCDNPCDKRKAKMEKEAQREKMLNENRII